MYQRIRDLREDRDLTQKNMGEILNCSQRIYSNYEYLLNLTDDKRPYPRKKNSST